MSKHPRVLLPDRERLAWKFLPYGIRRGEPIADPGIPRIVPGHPYRATDWQEMHEPVLSSSDRAIHALRDSTGLYVCRVRLFAPILRSRHSGKLHTSAYEILWEGNPTHFLIGYACDVAEQALQRHLLLGWPVEAFIFDVIRARREWLDGSLPDGDLAEIGRAVAEYEWQEVRQGLMSPTRTVTIIVGGDGVNPPYGHAYALARLAVAFGSPAGTVKQMLQRVAHVEAMQRRTPLGVDPRHVIDDVERLLEDAVAAGSQADAE